jgi:L-ascorbate metabolism protein UlaG (beta-lactamase superfamily)
LKLRYLSHACFELNNAKTVLIDPFFSENKLAPKYAGTPDLILITHEHFDHTDATNFDCLVLAPSTCKFKRMITVNIGDTFDFGDISIKVVKASLHDDCEYSSGYLINYEGKKVYHAGDTYLDAIEKIGKVDTFMIPIGGTYTMNIDEAVEALKIIEPDLAIPMHYNTFPVIKADPKEFQVKAENSGFKVKIMDFGEEIDI